MTQNVTDEVVRFRFIVTATRAVVVSVRSTCVRGRMFKLVVCGETLPGKRGRQKGDQHRCQHET